MTRTCIICKTEFTPKKLEQLCCCKECSVIHNRQQTKERNRIRGPRKIKNPITQDRNKCIGWVSDKTCKIIKPYESPSLCGRSCPFYQTQEQWRLSCYRAKERCAEKGVKFENLFGGRW